MPKSRRLIMYEDSIRAETAPPELKASSSPTKPEPAWHSQKLED